MSLGDEDFVLKAVIEGTSIDVDNDRPLTLYGYTLKMKGSHKHRRTNTHSHIKEFKGLFADNYVLPLPLLFSSSKKCLSLGA